MYVNRPSSSKGRVRPMTAQMMSVDLSLSPRPPATTTIGSGSVLSHSSDPTAGMGTVVFDRAPDEPVSFSRYRVLPSIDKKKTGHSQHSHTSGRDTAQTPPEDPDLLLAIRIPSGQRFRGRFRPSERLQALLSAAEAEFGQSFDQAVIETMDVPRRTFTNLTMTLAQCGVLDKTLLCISQDDSHTEPHTFRASDFLF